jgi:hypothetical protein
MKDLAIIILSLAIAGALRPDEPTPQANAPQLLDRKADPIPDAAGEATAAATTTTDSDSQVTETLPPESLVKDSSDFPPAGAEPDASDSSARGLSLVETPAPELEPIAPAPVAAYTHDRPTFTRYAACAGGNCAVNAAPIRRRLFGRFR